MPGKELSPELQAATGSSSASACESYVLEFSPLQYGEDLHEVQCGQVGARGTPPKQETVEGDTTTLTVTTGGKDVWVKVIPDIFGAPTQSYQLVVTEVASMSQVVSANELLQELNKNGFVALYINFDTGKADLKQDGVATVKEIATLMKANPTLKLSVEGHTNNVGDAASNKKLSEARAKSVTAAIVAGGVDAARLSATGFGQEKPVADNRTEEGRAKNRRVELVKRS